MKSTPKFTWDWNWLGNNDFEIYVCGYLADHHRFRYTNYLCVLSFEERKVLKRKAISYYEKTYKRKLTDAEKRM
jgi:hypothetical protein